MNLTLKSLEVANINYKQIDSVVFSERVRVHDDARADCRDDVDAAQPVLRVPAGDREDPRAEAHAARAAQRTCLS